MSAKSTAAQNAKAATAETQATGGVVEHLVEKFDEVMDAEAKAAQAQAVSSQVVLLSKGHARSVPNDSLIIVCREPGFRRAGIAHPAVEVYAADHFNAEQLAMLVAEPMLEVIGVKE